MIPLPISTAPQQCFAKKKSMATKSTELSFCSANYQIEHSEKIERNQNKTNQKLGLWTGPVEWTGQVEWTSGLDWTYISLFYCRYMNKQLQRLIKRAL